MSGCCCVALKFYLQKIQATSLWAVASTLTQRLEIRSSSPLTSFFFFAITLAFLGPLQVHINCGIKLSLLGNKKVLAGRLVSLNLHINLGRIDSLTIFCSPMHKHDVFLHLVWSSLIYLMNVCIEVLHMLC